MHLILNFLCKFYTYAFSLLPKLFRVKNIPVLSGVVVREMVTLHVFILSCTVFIRADDMKYKVFLE